MNWVELVPTSQKFNRNHMTLKYECYLIVLVNVHSVWLRAELLGCWTCDLLTGHV